MLACERTFLESFGYVVLAALSGTKGLELASIYSIDVVIVDYFMPEMNGQEFALQIREIRPQAPIIMLSGSMDVPERALKLVDAFISKDHLSSLLLPTLAQLHECDSIPQSAYNA